MKTKLFCLFLLLIMFSFNVSAQESFKSRFEEADLRMEDHYYDEALKIWLELLKEQPENANLNYKVGVCYLESPSTRDKAKALPYLEKAVKKTTANYKIYSYQEDKAPVEAYYYLAKAYQLNYKFEEAIQNYSIFLGKITDKHYLFADATKNIEHCTYAKKLIDNPVKLKVQNLGNKINTQYPEYSPVISVDESMLFFTSRRLRKDSSNFYAIDPQDGMYFEDIYMSYFIDGRWTEPQLLTLNTDGHEATVNLSADGQTLFIYKDENGNGELYYSTFDGQDWSVPQKFGSNINTEYFESHVAITPDNQRLYFVSNRPGGLGGKDIWFCNKLPNGQWALAQNAGPVINTPFDEDGVFIHPDGKTMYFSSKGHRGLGGYDIFYSTWDEEKNQWSTPVNIGYPINSTDDDVFFVVSTDGKRGYFSSIKPDGYGEKDIYVLEMYNVQEKALTLLIGTLKVAGMDKLPEDAQILVTNNQTQELVGKYKPRAIDGRFTIIIPPGSDYHIEYSAAGYTAEEDIYVPEASAYQELNKAIELKPIIFGEEKSNNTLADNKTKGNDQSNSNNTSGNANSSNNLTANNNLQNNKPEEKQVSGRPKASFVHYFEYNIKDIDPNSKEFKKFIDDIVLLVEKNGSVRISIESSASKVPTKTFITNENLSEKRALEAKLLIYAALREKNIKSNQVTIDKITTLVQGPDYRGDYQNKKKYEKYQYVKLQVY